MSVEGDKPYSVSNYTRQGIWMSTPNATWLNQSNITANQKHVWAGSLWKRTALATKCIRL